MSNDFDLIRKTVENELADYEFRLGFSPESAWAAAYLIWEKQNFYKWCTPESRAKCLLDMLVFGLNPLKKQCYFIPYGKTLTFVMDYSGAIIVAKDVNKTIKDIRAKIYKEGDDFKFSIVNGIYVIDRHEPTIESLDGKHLAAYAVAVDFNDKPVAVDIINYSQYVNHVKKTSKPIDGTPVVLQDGTFFKKSNHYKWPEQMFKKTIIHQLCRQIIKTSPNEKILEASSRAVADDFSDDGYIVSEPDQPEPQAIDFVPRQEPQATPEQADKIVEIAEQIGEKDYFMQDISSFVQRDIKKLRELTEREADRYIDMKLKSIVQQPIQDEPAGDETPPWK